MPDGDSKDLSVSTSATVHISATTGVSATFEVSDFTKLWVGVSSLTSGTVDLKADVGGGYQTVGSDLFDTDYPRGSFTGDEVLAFLVPPGVPLSFSTSATCGGNVAIKAMR